MLACQKSLFSLPEDIHYLNCAYKGPLLKSAEWAAVRALKAARNPATTQPEDFFAGAAKARQLFATLINGTAEEIAIIPSTSYGMATVVHNVPYQKGQHAIVLGDEFPSDYFTVERWCKTHGAELKVVKPDPKAANLGTDWHQKLLDSITQDTAMVVMSSVQWSTGLKFDLEFIGAKCATVGAKFIVDGAQSVGALPMDVQKYHIDALICPAYKWLLGPYSLGLAYISPTFHEGTPLEESWMNRTNAESFGELTKYEERYTPGAGRFNMGESSQFLTMPILIENLRQLNKWTIPAIKQYCQHLAKPLFAYLMEHGIELHDTRYFSPHMFQLPLPAHTNLENLYKTLIKNKIYLSRRGNAIRVSLNVFNDEKDINALIQALDTSVR